MYQKLILSWQDVKTNQWFPIGQFSREDSIYSFNYVKGSQLAEKNGFTPLAGMSDFNEKYYYNDIFPLFKNRILNKSRPDREEFLKWLNIESNNSDFEELAKTGGIKATDNLQLFPVPIKKNNKYILEFFSQGISHLPNSSQKRIEELKEGDKLFFCADLENKQDKNAHILRTNDPVEITGYCPKYFVDDFKKLFNLSKNTFNIKVKQVNKDAPEQLKLLCKIDCDWHEDFEPFSENKFQTYNKQ